MNISERLKMVRGSVSQAEFAAIFGVGTNTIYRYESGKNPPDTDFIIKVCEKFNINPSWLLFGEEPKHRREKRKAEAEETSADQTLEEDINIQQLLNMTAKVLLSDTIYRPALAANIKAFNRSIEIEMDNRELRSRLERIEEKMVALEERLGGEKKGRRRIIIKLPRSQWVRSKCGKIINPFVVF